MKIVVRALLPECPIHKDYKAMRVPISGCWECNRIWDVVCAVRNWSPEYIISRGDKREVVKVD